MEKNILLVAATSKEIVPFLEWYRKNIPGYEADILITGIGLTAATYHISRQLLVKKYGLVIQAGVAGSYKTDLPPGAVVVIKQDTIADQSVVELKKLKTLFDLKLVPSDQRPYKRGWLVNPDKTLLRLTGLKQVSGISVNEISTSKQMIKFYRETFDPVTESMEGAALHFVCLMENIPFLQIRSISNYIGERNKKKWDMNDSIINLNESLIRIIRTHLKTIK